MKNAPLTIRNASFAILAACSLGPLASHADNRNGHSDEAAFFPWRFADRIEGAWNVAVDITVCATGGTITSFDAMSLFGANGTFHDTNATPSALRSEAFGYWKRVGKHAYEFAFRFFRFDATGASIGATVVRHDVLLSHRGDTYTSEGTAEFYDAVGNLTATGCSSSTATRFR